VAKETLSDFDWVYKHLEELLDYGDECCTHYSETFNDYGLHTPLKLCVLMDYVDIYTKILKPRVLSTLKCEGKVFLDVFAGAGVTQIVENHKVAGSLPIAIRYCKRSPFDHYYGIELNEEFHKALEKRVDYLGVKDKSTIIKGDSDEKLHEIIEEIKEKKHHYLAFVDYEDLKGLSWDSLKELLDYKKGDLIITLINSYRPAGRANSFSEGDRRTLEKLYSKEVVGASTIDGDIDHDLLMDNYYKLIRKHRAHTVEIKINDKGCRYRLLYATRNTSGDSPYVNSVKAIKERVEKIDGDTVNAAVNQLRRGQQRLF